MKSYLIQLCYLKNRIKQLSDILNNNFNSYAPSLCCDRVLLFSLQSTQDKYEKVEPCMS